MFQNHGDVALRDVVRVRMSWVGLGDLRGTFSNPSDSMVHTFLLLKAGYSSTTHHFVPSIPFLSLSSFSPQVFCGLKCAEVLPDTTVVSSSSHLLCPASWQEPWVLPQCTVPHRDA